VSSNHEKKSFVQFDIIQKSFDDHLFSLKVDEIKILFYFQYRSSRRCLAMPGRA
jgi:hypothetical protein